MHNNFGDRSFGAVGPRIWNSLLRGLRTLDISYKHFKALLKTYVSTRPRRIVTFYISALEIFLLTSSSFLVYVVCRFGTHVQTRR